MPHTHPCRFTRHGCTHRVFCAGPLERNYDGFPEVICGWLEPDGTLPLCELCEDGPACEDCGLPAHLGHVEGCDSAAAQAKRADDGPPDADYELGNRSRDAYVSAWAQKVSLR
jgi:hypothetical protein